jgi:pilus assembly protein Flp/PilA
MTRFVAIAKKLVRGEEGATMVEYGLMLALIAVICFAGVSAVGKNANSLFTSVAGTL